MTISIRRNRKAHFNPSQYNRRIRMSSSLSADLRKVLNFRSFPISKNDEVVVISGRYKGKTGTVTSVNRREYKVSIDSCTKIINGKTVNDLVDASNLRITKMNVNRECVTKKRQAMKKKREEIKNNN